ncbi:MAG: hypothetical protein WCW25_00380 [Patescibacteria group bacterium]|jgi:hypothetical protein
MSHKIPVTEVTIADNNRPRVKYAALTANRPIKVGPEVARVISHFFSLKHWCICGNIDAENTILAVVITMSCQSIRLFES